MERILLDRDGDARIPEGYLLVDSEVEFLKQATEPVSLLIRGQTLCDWAERFYKSRRLDYRFVLSPTKELMNLCPDLTLEQAQHILQKLGDSFFALERPLTTKSLLQALYPMDLWERPPSAQHAAEWLLWLDEQKPEQEVLPLLKAMGQQWKNSAPDEIKIFYGVHCADEARKLLEPWLGIHECSIQLPEFPVHIDIPDRWLENARQAWKPVLIQSRGGYISDLLKSLRIYSLKRVAVDLAKAYFHEHPKHLTKDILNDLRVHLNLQEQQVFFKMLPPQEPAAIPESPGEVLSWFEHQYLPYRTWQTASGGRDDRERVHSAATQFAKWYLRFCPGALLGSEQSYLTFRKSAYLKADTKYVTLVVVPDGMPVWDSEELLKSVLRKTRRLSVLSRSFAFAPVPTITHFCKEALFKGVPPKQALSGDNSSKPIGIIVPEKNSPVDILKQATAGGVYIWRVLEPDKTYHERNLDEMLHSNVKAEIEGIAEKIADIVSNTPPHVQLRVVITTDHGRLMAPRSDRCIPVPDGMEAHGRAAYGNGIQRSFPAEGYIKEGEVVYLSPDLFGVPEQVAVVLSENTFRTQDGRGGTEAYPHGGLYPEEVVVPWIVLARDSAEPEIKIKVRGQARARQPGKINVKITNLSEYQLLLQSVTLLSKLGGKQIIDDIEFLVKASSEEDIDLSLTSWFSAEEASSIQVVAKLKNPIGEVFDCKAEADIQVDTMYRRENILGDLE